jgi:hypothetical protein
MDCIEYISRVDVLVGRSTHVDSLVFFEGQLYWALSRFMILELPVLTLVLTVFDKLS